MIPICRVSPQIFPKQQILKFKKLVLLRWCSKTSSEIPLAEGYQPQEVEAHKWESRKSHITAQPTKRKRGIFRMLLPPPNVTGDLHLGHALMAIVQDVICRQRRHLGFEVEWTPGTDHAGIATQVIVEKKLMKERNVTRKQLGREGFIREVWKWKDQKGESIVDDLQKLGCTLNWEREYFTMDKNHEKAVNAAFVKLFDKGLIKRQKSLVNWSCILESAISDIEVDKLMIKGITEIAVPGYEANIIFGRLYNIAFRVCNSDEEIMVSTTRPETILGDVAIAVHPEDNRFQKYRNQDVKLQHPFRKDSIPLIFDSSVDPKFGTGAVKITPAHDKKDFAIAESHSLVPVEIFNEEGCVRSEFVEFAGLKRFTARERILDYLAEKIMLREVKNHDLILPICSRSNDILEYMLRPQWFLHCQPLADAAISEVRNYRLQLHPQKFQKEWFRWLENCHDWCISRQLWWGHQIPAYHAVDESGSECWVAALDETEALKKAQSKLNSNQLKLARDTDVLDTWFSASLLPLSAYNWPSVDFRHNHITLDLLETGHDILFFWVARMVMLSLNLVGALPFKNVLLNGLICDSHGRKMSKSLGNVISPQQVIHGITLKDMKTKIESSFTNGEISKNEYTKSLEGVQKMFPDGIKPCGTDALRFTLCSHNIMNHFINFDINECYTNKLFLNKIWQATRFTLGAAQRLKLSFEEMESLNNVQLGYWDLWILSRLANTLKVYTESFETYNIHLGAAALKHFFYNNFCDVYLEIVKADINAANCSGYIHCATLATSLSLALNALAPYTPYITQALLQHLPQNPQLNLNKYFNDSLEKEIEKILEICQNIRQVKSRHKISRKHEPILVLQTTNTEGSNFLKGFLTEIQTLTKCNSVRLQLPYQDNTKSEHSFHRTSAGPLCTFCIETNTSFIEDENATKELGEQYKKKLEKLQSQLKLYRLQVQNTAFQKMASPNVQKRHLEKIQYLEEEILNIKSLGGS